MRFSAPIYVLKRRAKLLSRDEGLPLHQALDRIAREEGYDSWSLLARRASAAQPGAAILAELLPGDLVLLGARPGQGKTLLGLEIAIAAMKRGSRGVFFTLECTGPDVSACFEVIGEDPIAFHDRFEIDDSDEICGSYIIDHLGSARAGTVVVIDYLQQLDQRRDSPELSHQIAALRDFVRDRGLICILISQVHRRFNPNEKPFPELTDVRLPNALDLKVFDKACFLNNGEVSFSAVA